MKLLEFPLPVIFAITASYDCICCCIGGIKSKETGTTASTGLMIIIDGWLCTKQT